MTDIEATLESLLSAASWMESNPIATATKLLQVLDELDGWTMTDDYSSVPSCVAFAQSYKSAVEVYRAAAKDMLADARKMKSALEQTHHGFAGADQSSEARLTAVIAAIGETPTARTDASDQTYQHDKRDLHSDQRQAPPSSETDGDTGGTGTPASTTPPPATTGGGRVGVR